MESVADDFRNVYKHEWREAHQSLSNEKHDEEIIYLLMRVVRGVYDFCLDEAKMSNEIKKPAGELAKEFILHRLPFALHKDHVTNPMKAFIQRCMECSLKLCSMELPPYIQWVPKGETIDLDKFEIHGNRSGHTCDWTIWPAVITNEGTVLTKGIVIPV